MQGSLHHSGLGKHLSALGYGLLALVQACQHEVELLADFVDGCHGGWRVVPVS